MRAFVTGASGFVGTWLVRHLEEMGDEAVALRDGIDVTDGVAVCDALAAAAPEVVYHLAALTHVGDSWEAPEATFRVNAIGTLSVLEAARQAPDPPKVILVSSAEVYGPASSEPIDETSPLRPVTPYAASKVAAEYLGLQAYLGRGLDVVRARPFNHVGPGQTPAFVVAALAKRLVEAERAGALEVSVGDLSPERDFTDVRDVVRAYRLLAEHGVSGEAYNVSSGEAVSIATVFEELVALSGHEVKTSVDQALLRPVDVPVFVGDSAKLVALTDWSRTIPFETTLKDVLSDARRRW